MFNCLAEGGEGRGGIERHVFGISFRVIPNGGYLPKELCVLLCGSVQRGLGSSYKAASPLH